MKEIAQIIILLFVSCSSMLAQNNSLSSKDYLLKGQKNLEAKKYDEAILNFDSALARDKENWIAYRLRGDCNRELRKFSDAISDYSNALKINSSDTLSLKQKANAEMLNNYIKEALEDFNKAISIDSADEFLRIGRGQCLAHIGDYDGAIADFNFFIKKQPTLNSYAYFIRGLTYLEDKQYRKAITDFNRYILMKGNIDAVFFNRGVAYTHLGESFADSAVKDLLRYKDFHPDSPGTFKNLGISYSLKMDSIEARKNFERCIEINPNDMEVRYVWAGSELNFNNFGKALELLNKVFPHIKKPSYENLYLFGLAKAGTKDTVGAAKAYEDAIKLDSVSQEVHAARIKLYYSSAKYSKILLSDFARLIHSTQDPNRLGLLHASRSLVFSRIKDLNAADADIKKAEELSPKLPIVSLLNGILILRKGGGADDALSNFNKAIELDSKLKEAYLLQACLYRNKGDVKKGCAQLNKATSLGEKVSKEFKDRICSSKSKPFTVSEMEQLIHPYIKEAIVNP